LSFYLVAFVVVAGRTGSESLVDWLTLVGLVGITMGCLNLLPVSPSNSGFHLLHMVAAACLGRRRLPDRVIMPLAWLGMIVMLVFFARFMWLDVTWIWANITR
jgi:membrane-associated protease RseP (regulator of RpoE activity)